MIKSRLNSTLLALVCILILIAFFLFANVKAGGDYPTCADVYAATGRKDILRGDRLYNASMDREVINGHVAGDGIACE